jgi:hypothetical protein
MNPSLDRRKGGAGFETGAHPAEPPRFRNHPHRRTDTTVLRYIC